MGRWIDVDDLIKLLGFENTQEEREENAGEIITLEGIDNLPTAYDVDKVVEQLNKIEEHCIGMCDWQGQSAIENAIEIVKGGGVE